MMFPDTAKSMLDTAIEKTLQNSEHLSPGTFTRNRKLPAATVMKTLITMQGGSLQKELYDAGLDVSAAAFVARRKKLPSLDFENVLEQFNAFCRDGERFRGYRVLAVDGTAINLPRNPSAPSFVQNASNPRGYNQLHVTPLYDVLAHTYAHCVIQEQPRQDEIGALLAMLAWYDFDEPTLIVADRGFESYNLFATLQNTPNADFLIRVKQDRSAMRPIAELPMRELDTEVSFTITTRQTNHDKEQGYIFIQTHKNEKRTYSPKTKASRWDFPSPYPMTLRVVRFRLSTGEFETLVTSLPRTISAAHIRELYHARWGIETAFRELKYGIGLVNLHGKSDEFARQEIFSAMILSNFCARIAKSVVIQRRQGQEHLYQVNMKMAIHLCRRFLRGKDGEPQKLLRDIARYAEPVRPGRCDERNLKAKSFVGFVYRVAA